MAVRRCYRGKQLLILCFLHTVPKVRTVHVDDHQWSRLRARWNLQVKCGEMRLVTPMVKIEIRVQRPMHNFPALLRASARKPGSTFRPSYSTSSSGPRSRHAQWYADILPAMIPIAILGSAVYLVSSAALLKALPRG